MNLQTPGRIEIDHLHGLRWSCWYCYLAQDEFPLIHFTKLDTKSRWVLLKYLETCLVYYGGCKTSEFTRYGEPSDALPSLYFSLSDKPTHKTLFYWTSNMKCSGAVFCYTHTRSNNNLRIICERNEKRKATHPHQEALWENKHPPSLRSVKQYSLAWNSLAIFFCIISNKSWIFYENPFTLHDVAYKYGSRNWKMLFPRSQTQHSQDVPDCSLSDILQILFEIH